MKMPRNSAKAGIKAIEVTVDIKYGSGSPAQRQAFYRFFQKIIAEAKSEAKNG